MRGCDLRSFQCEDEGAYYAYVTEIRDTQKGRKVRPSLRLVVEHNDRKPNYILKNKYNIDYVNAVTQFYEY